MTTAATTTETYSAAAWRAAANQYEAHRRAAGELARKLAAEGHHAAAAEATAEKREWGHKAWEATHRARSLEGR